MKLQTYVFYVRIFIFSIFLFSSKILTAQNLTQADFTGLIVPQYLCSGSTSLPVVFRATVSGLASSALYRYYVRAVLSSDFGSTTSGAGNPVLMNSNTSTFSYTSSPVLSTTGRYETFTTDPSGSYTGWFCLTNTNNAKFTPGNIIYPTITLNNGAGGTVINKRLALDLGITVLQFATSAGAFNGTGIWGNTNSTAKNMMVLYDNIAGSGRPLSVTYVENSGITIPSLVGYYSSNVETVTGAWGTIIPNTLPNGIRKIEQLALSDASVTGSSTDADGIWGCLSTINPLGGSSSPIKMSNYVLPNNITFSNQSSVYYRSKNNGDWCNVNNWEASTDNILWNNATKVPDNNESDITISGGHSIRIYDTQNSLMIDQTNISTNATLIWKSNTLTIADGTGIDLLVNGTFYDSSSANINFATYATWALTANANYIKSGSGVATGWRDNYHLGMSSIPVNSNWYIRKSGTMNPALTSIGATYYGNLIVDNNSGTAWDAFMIASKFSGFSDFPTIKGNFDIGGSEADAVIFYSENNSPSPILVKGNVTIKNGCGFVLDDATTTTGSTGLEVQGNLTVNGFLDYTITDVNNTNRLLLFSGNSDQVITGIGSLRIYNLKSDKTAGSLILDRNITIDNILTLTNGKIDLNQNKITINNGTSGAVSRTNGWLESEDTDNSSKVQWNIGTSIGQHIFPFGKNASVYIPFIFNLISGNIGNITVSTYGTPANNLPWPLAPQAVLNLDRQGIDNSTNTVDRFWQLDKTGTTGVADIIFTYDDAEEPSNEVNLAAQRYDKTTDNWQIPWVTQSDNPTNNTITVTGVTSFSAWTLTAINLPLPLQLLSFKATNTNNIVLLNWMVSDINELSYFKIQRSVDGITFEDITTVNKTNKNNYVYEDKVFEDLKILYYRIKIIGNTENYSAILLIDLKQQYSAAVYPNPFENIINISTDENSTQNIKVKVLDVYGSVLMEVFLNDSVHFIKTEQLVSGVYYINISTDFLNETHVLIKE
jgi:hypothetical protein